MRPRDSSATLSIRLRNESILESHQFIRYEGFFIKGMESKFVWLLDYLCLSCYFWKAAFGRRDDLVAQLNYHERRFAV